MQDPSHSSKSIYPAESIARQRVDTRRVSLSSSKFRNLYGDSLHLVYPVSLVAARERKLSKALHSSFEAHFSLLLFFPPRLSNVVCHQASCLVQGKHLVFPSLSRPQTRHKARDHASFLAFIAPPFLPSSFPSTLQRSPSTMHAYTRLPLFSSLGRFCTSSASVLVVQKASM